MKMFEKNGFTQNMLKKTKFQNILQKFDEAGIL